MAKKRTKGRGENVMGYFRQLFKENPDWLYEKSNAVILNRYRADHELAPDAPVEQRVKNNLANLKSTLRREAREAGALPHAAPAATGVAKARGSQRLEALEEMIDESMTLAKNLDREGLQQVIILLRRARNEVVWKLGQ